MLTLRFLVRLRSNTWFGQNKMRQLPFATLIGIFIVENSTQMTCTRTSLRLQFEHFST